MLEISDENSNPLAQYQIKSRVNLLNNIKLKFVFEVNNTALLE
jgi:hypothetical protein